MGLLTLVRHAQARDDALTDAGRLQARRLGEYWLNRSVHFDRVQCGVLRRQRETARIVGEVCRAGGQRWPEVQIERAWDEYDVPGMLEHLLPELARRNPHVRELAQAWQARRGDPDENRHFQKLFEPLLGAWLDGSASDPRVEPWPVFRNRVQDFLRRLRDVPSQGRRIAVFTSGGPIGVAVQTALGAPEAAAVEVNWRVRNGSLTSFLFSRGRLSLDSFNATPHLGPDLETFR